MGKIRRRKLSGTEARETGNNDEKEKNREIANDTWSGFSSLSIKGPIAFTR